MRKETSEGTQTGAGVAQSAAIDATNDDTRLELSWKHNGIGWLNELQFTHEDAPFMPSVPNSGTNGRVFTWFNGNDNNILALDGADPRAAQNKTQKGWSVGNTITFTDVGGAHTIKAGAKYKVVDLIAADSLPGNPVFYYDVTPAGAAS